MDDRRRRSGLTRRDFLRQVGMAGIAGVAGWRAVEAGESIPFAAQTPTATVVLLRDEKALRRDGSVDPEAVRRMVSRGIRTLTNEQSEKSAWAHLFRPSDVVGIKFSRCGWMRVPTRQEVIDAVSAGLKTVPVDAGKIHAADSGLPASMCTALINATSLKAHTLTGFAAAIKNYINFHPDPQQYHRESGRNLGEIWLRPEVRGKTRLVVLDLITPYFGSGPQIDPRYQADYRGILLATDPVAADTVALHLCQRMRDRHRGKPWPISPPPFFLAAADKEYHLGTADPARIKVVRLGWKDNILV